MKTCLAVMAHEGAAATIGDFQPRWERLGLPILAFMPEGQAWPGSPVQAVFQQGISAHRGSETYRRFMLMCETLAVSEYDSYVMIEYDTVNLSDRLPSFVPETLNCAFLKTFGPDVESQLGRSEYVICLSPWIVARAPLLQWIEAMKRLFSKPMFSEWTDGLLDRWLAISLMGAGMVANNITEAYSWPCNDPNAHNRIDERGWHWIHGWKRKKDFKHLWSNQ